MTNAELEKLLSKLAPQDLAQVCKYCDAYTVYDTAQVLRNTCKLSPMYLSDILDISTVNQINNIYDISYDGLYLALLMYIKQCEPELTNDQIKTRIDKLSDKGPKNSIYDMIQQYKQMVYS